MHLGKTLMTSSIQRKYVIWFGKLFVQNSLTENSQFCCTTSLSSEDFRNLSLPAACTFQVIGILQTVEIPTCPSGKRFFLFPRFEINVTVGKRVGAINTVNHIKKVKVNDTSIQIYERFTLFENLEIWICNLLWTQSWLVHVITTFQRICRKVMFSVVSVCLFRRFPCDHCPGYIGLHHTGTLVPPQTWDLTVQGPLPTSGHGT